MDTSTPTDLLLKSILILLIAYATYTLYIYPFHLSPLRHLPGPPVGLPLLGQTYNIFTGEGPTSHFLRWSATWPSAPFIRYISVGHSEVLLLNSLQAHKEVLQTKTYSFVKPAFFKRLVGSITGVGLLFADKDEHIKQRRLIAAPFSAPNIRKLLPVFEEKAEDLVKTLETAIDATGEGFAVLEVSSILNKVALDTIGRTALGIELRNLSAASSDHFRPVYNFEEAYHHIFNPSVLGGVLQLIDTVIPIRAWCPLKANTTFVNANKDLHRMIRQVISERKQTIGGTRKHGSDGQDILTFMLEERSDTWTDEEILGHMLTIMVAGHGTTGLAMTWAIHALNLYPHIQDRLRAEILTLPESYSAFEIEQLPYLHNFLMEVLRLYNPAWQGPREAREDVTIAGVFIPKGTSINLNYHIMNKHPDLWGPTALCFDPERWGNRGEGIDPYMFQTFLNGPMICPGRSFALLELKCVLKALVGNFRYEGIGEDVVVDTALTFRPKGGLRTKISKI